MLLDVGPLTWISRKEARAKISIISYHFFTHKPEILKYVYSVFNIEYQRPKLQGKLFKILTLNNVHHPLHLRASLVPICFDSSLYRKANGYKDLIILIL